MKNPKVTCITSFISHSTIMEEVSKEFSISPENLKSNSRQWKYVIPRKICWLFLEEINGYSHEKIGKLFNRNRSTVSIGLKSINRELEVDKRLWEKCAKLAYCFARIDYQNGL